jgi:hypothetical protein
VAAWISGEADWQQRQAPAVRRFGASQLLGVVSASLAFVAAVALGCC